MFSNALETFLVRYGRFFGESYPQRWHFRAGPLFPGVTQLENVISEGIIHQKIVRSARGMSLEHSKTCGTCSAGVTYSTVNRVWQNAGYWRRCLLLNLHKAEIEYISKGVSQNCSTALNKHLSESQVRHCSATTVRDMTLIFSSTCRSSRGGGPKLLTKSLYDL